MLRHITLSGFYFAVLLSLTGTHGVIYAQRDPESATDTIVKPNKSSSSTSRGSSPRRRDKRRSRSTPSVVERAAKAIKEGDAAFDAEEYDKAETYYRKAISLNSTEANAYIGLGNTYHNLKRYDEAIDQYRKALQFDPNNVVAINNLGSAYARLRRYAEAIEQQRKALDLNPDYAFAYNSHAWLLATAGNAEFRDGKQAVEYALKACELTKYQSPDFLDTLAAAYAEAGDFKKAIEWQKKALGFPGFKDETAPLRLELYVKGQPYRE